MVSTSKDKNKGIVKNSENAWTKSALLFGKQHIISSFKRKLQDDERQDATHT